MFLYKDYMPVWSHRRFPFEYRETLCAFLLLCYTAFVISCRSAYRLPARLLKLLATASPYCRSHSIKTVLSVYWETGFFIIGSTKNQFYRPHLTRVYLTRASISTKNLFCLDIFRFFVVFCFVCFSLRFFSFFVRIFQLRIMDFDLRERKLFD